ncbi:MAG: glycerol-3-phosphate 1-O-acyltransferase PlsY [Lachnospiraceae bacterium]|nr:glycerol-3-phosphate 1-O-acyltransferase PlsY [Lachnospiraceae bacterium]
MVIARIVSIVIGYVFGLFETSYLYGKMKNTDIREHGSGNAGTTNALRTFGVWGGVITLLGDVCKSILAIVIAYLLFHNQYPDSVKLLMMYAGLGAILGHNFPFYLSFKGGKGIACTGGFIIAFCPAMVPLCLAVFVGAIVVTRYVSLGSLLVVIVFYMQLLIFGNQGMLGVDYSCLNEIYLLGAVIVVMAFVRHRGNIVKLWNHNENKISFHKKEEEK